RLDEVLLADQGHGWRLEKWKPGNARWRPPGNGIATFDFSTRDGRDGPASSAAACPGEGEASEGDHGKVDHPAVHLHGPAPGGGIGLHHATRPCELLVGRRERRL